MTNQQGNFNTGKRKCTIPEQSRGGLDAKGTGAIWWRTVLGYTTELYSSIESSVGTPQ